jgi:hypothetical protein
MANLPETSEWEDGIYQLEPTDPVMGGPGGIANLQATQLGNCTAYLKQSLDQVNESVALTIPAPPTTGTATLQSIDGVMQWV